MADKKYFDVYSEHLSAKIEKNPIDADVQEKILERTLHKIETRTKDQKYQSHEKQESYENRENQLRYQRQSPKWIKSKRKSLVAACFILLFLSGFVNATPVNALYRSIFQFIPGVGIVKSEENMGISRATSHAYRVTSNAQFIEIKYAYVQNKTLVFSALTNIDHSAPKVTMDSSGKKTVISGKSKLGVYLWSEDQKIYLTDYTVASSNGTDVKKIEGTFYLEKVLEDSKVTLGIDDFDASIELELEEIKADDAPDKLGNSLFIGDLLIFADLERDGDVATLNMSSVLPSEYQNLRFYLFDDEQKIYNSSIQIMDGDGNRYYPDEKKREANNADIDTFYFNIPEHITGLKVIVPQMIFDTKVMGEIKVKSPKWGEYIKVDQHYNMGEIDLEFKGLTLVSKENDVTLKAIGEDALRFDFTAAYKAGSKQSIFQVHPDIQVKRGFKYVRTSSMGIAPYWMPEQTEGHYYCVLDEQEDVAKLSVEIRSSNVLKGPYEIRIENKKMEP
ncbi:hypothetical protein [Fusibacter ferrireducens]|uniref:DUF4179 domain-containing protein n=1 Tax=Fusibacter ferrireducens TaxID=2785058 RepID=A0ABR9ZPX2_9FIRM|nr:hypothetical protein [Fusibacter ferrireducens]MBF4692487.1 hypothetical protein [Fusibacter ferrireducens]